MTVILFVVDTSTSMAQKNYKGSSTLDVCKNIVSDFMKARGRDVSARGFDRYILLTTEEFPSCVKEFRTSWRDTALTEQMKPLRPTGKNGLSTGINNAFRLLNSNRGSTGIDNYGYGRYPYFMEPVYIFTLSDGASADDITKDFKVDTMQKPDLTREAHRWDQKLFSLVIRLSAQHPTFNSSNRIDPDGEHVERLCRATGGRSFSISCHKQISQCIDQVIASMQVQGISVRFQCPARNNAQNRLNGEAVNISNDLSAEQRLKKRLDVDPLTTIVIRMVGGKPVNNHWPIPEAFWHTRLENGSLPLRDSQPTIVVGVEAVPSAILPDLPFDKYELAPSPVVDYVLERFKENSSDQCLWVFVHNSGRTEGFGKPFGYIKLASSGTSVNLFLMPYNYPVLIKLLEELKADQSLRMHSGWKKRLDTYLENVPPYYLTALRKNLTKFRITGSYLDDPNLPAMYPQTITAMLGRLRVQMKEEYDKTVATITTLNQQQQLAPGSEAQLVEVERRERMSKRAYWKNEIEVTGSTKPKKSKDPRASNEEGIFKDPDDELEIVSDKTQVQIHLSDPPIRPSVGSTFRNPLILKKGDLVNQIPKMRSNIALLLRDSAVALLEGGRPGLHIKLHHAEELHSQPISGMGNYEDYSKAMQAIGRGPLREVEPKAVRSHAFGNPFKTDKKSLAIDEVGEGPTIDSSSAKESRRDRKASSSTSNRPPKRKPGPLAHNFLGHWRERLRSVSERSSVVSDVSYQSEMDTDTTNQPSSSQPPLQNGVHSKPICNGASGDGNDVKLIEAVENMWGLEEEMEEIEDGECIPPKRLRVESKPVIDHLGLEELHRRKLLLRSAICSFRRGDTLLVEIRRMIEGTSPQDCLELFEFCLRECLRFKRSLLGTSLNAEVTRLRKLLLNSS